MRRILQFVLVALALFAPQASHAASSAQKMLLLSGCPAQARIGGLCPTGPSLNFTQGFYWVPGQGSVSYTSLISTSRASQETCTWSSGLLTYAANNVPCITDLGLQVWEGRTNVELWSRDLTNAAWTKSNVTAALDQVGADGAANSASSIVATAGNGTVLQAITLASSARFQSVYMKRLVGTGEIDMTMDNGVTWTRVDAGINSSSFTRVSIPTQTLANPTVGFRIVTNGDKVAVDFSQNENGTFASPPIPTTTTSAARAADVPQLTGQAASAALAAKAAFFQTMGVAGGTTPHFMRFDGNAILFFSTTTQVATQNASAQQALATIGGAGTYAGVVKFAAGFDASSMTAKANNGTQVTSVNAWAGNTGNVYLGNAAAGTRALNGYMQRFALSPAKGAFDNATSP